MTSKNVASKRYTHAVVYIGAPYGDNEGGHIVSLHESKGGALKALYRMSELAAREHRIVGLDNTAAGSRWVFGDVKTPRDYFMLG